MEKAKFLMRNVWSYIYEGIRHLDIACGDGEVLHLFETNRSSYSVGIEYSRNRIVTCKKGGLTIVYADMDTSLPFGDGIFDVVTMISTIEHVQHPSSLIEEIDRVLSPNGLIVIQIPNPYFPFDLHYFLPLYGYLPLSIQKRYRDFFVKNGYGFNYYTSQITKKEVGRVMANFTRMSIRKIVYPKGVAPYWLRPLYKVYEVALSWLFPTGYLFVYQKK